MSSYRDFIKDPQEAAALEAMAKYKQRKWKICKKCGKEATTIDCRGAYLFPVCEACVSPSHNTKNLGQHLDAND